MTCTHPIFLQGIEGTTVICSACGRASVDLMQVQEKHKGETWKFVTGFMLERHRGSITPAPDFFGLMESVSGPKVAQAADVPGRP